ncbi:hypothetical protein FA045_14280 [Pedobacter cryotolerans]|uniref:Uncharacterized protein n=2 Tax=Pedobacter cryotolerans TaxID=2571270 RepID=A0A4U1BYV0_9SPHI|nr:hypothetical protein FA045_14280 [Pedobacter cryotolerans]
MAAFFTVNAIAQTAIEKQTVSSTSSVLDFAAGTTKGIILPAVETLPTTPANGTFLLDKNDKKIKMYQNGAWVELSNTGDITTIVSYSGTVDNGKQTIIGSRTTKVVDVSGNYVDGPVDGVLVLESPNKALVLPKVANPHLTVKSPYPGMMCYDTVSKSLAVYDGKLWNYWK